MCRTFLYVVVIRDDRTICCNQRYFLIKIMNENIFLNAFPQALIFLRSFPRIHFFQDFFEIW